MSLVMFFEPECPSMTWAQSFGCLKLRLKHFEDQFFEGGDPTDPSPGIARAAPHEVS